MVNHLKLKSRRQGFMLSEAVLALFVSAITIGILQSCLKIFDQVKVINSSENIRWHVINEKLQNEFANITVVKMDSQKMIYHKNDVKNNTYAIKYFQMKNGNNIIQRTTVGGGFSPIIGKLSNFKISRIGNNLMFKITNKQGIVTEMYFTNVQFQD
ncbi:hypothetical protein FHL04_03715 [Lactobacillus salsicarnum]|nr:hypothetical protein [Companilactobacillus mishanensis]